MSGKPPSATFEMLEQRYNEITEELTSLDCKRKDRISRAGAVKAFVNALKDKEP